MSIYLLVLKVVNRVNKKMSDHEGILKHPTLALYLFHAFTFQIYNRLIIGKLKQDLAIFNTGELN